MLLRTLTVTLELAAALSGAHDPLKRIPAMIDAS
jgi:hypothetical protein